jgi:hypothetical protein
MATSFLRACVEIYEWVGIFIWMAIGTLFLIGGLFGRRTENMNTPHWNLLASLLGPIIVRTLEISFGIYLLISCIALVFQKMIR